MKAKKEKEPDLNYIFYFKRPELVSTLPEGTYSKVFAGSNYCYALDENKNELYSWGMGYNYVLGTREEENSYVPVKVHPKMFFDCKIRTVGCGTQHVVVLTSSSETNNEEPKFDFSLPLPEVEIMEEEEKESYDGQSILEH